MNNFINENMADDEMNNFINEDMSHGNEQFINEENLLLWLSNLLMNILIGKYLTRLHEVNLCL